MKRIALFIVPLLLITTACSRSTPVQGPAQFAAAPSFEGTEASIHYALAQRGWMVQEQTPGSITAVLIKRRHKLWAHITYDHQQVHVAFAGSEGLEQSQDGAGVRIHKRANTWLVNLQQTIGLTLAQGGPPAPPPPRQWSASVNVDVRGAPPPPPQECKLNSDGSNTCGYNCKLGSNGYHYCASEPGGQCALNSDGTWTCP